MSRYQPYQQQRPKVPPQDGESLTREEAEDLRWLLQDFRGRRFLWGLLRRTGVFGTTFDGTSRTYHLEGKRHVGVRLMQQAQEIEPGAYSQMVAERMNELAAQQAKERAKQPRRDEDE